MPPQPSDPTSASLLQRARQQDEQAWGQLVHLYGPLVHRWCRRAGLREDDVADVFQETFRSVAAHLGSFQPARSVGSFRSWLRTIVRSKVVDHFRRAGQQPQGAGGTIAQLEMARVADPLADDAEGEEEEAAEDHAVIVQRAMELIRPEFSSRNWTAFQQVALEGRTAVEVAEEMGVNAQTVRQANYRIRRRLRLVLQDLVE